MYKFIVFLKANKVLLICLILAAVLRFWNLGSIPPHLRNDEASFGYNAYSILTTGKDEHGELLRATITKSVKSLGINKKNYRRRWESCKVLMKNTT